MLSTKTAVVLATGPSLTPEVLAAALAGQEEGQVSVFGMNHVWRDFPTLDVFLSCNPEYYDTQWERGLKDLAAEKWTWHKPTALKYGIRHIGGRWGDGFSTDPRVIHYGHGSGFQLPQIAYHAGFRRLLLCGYDMRYAEDYDGKNHRVGSSPRHYFGEYEDKQLNHWPSVKVRNGVHVELIQQFEKVKRLNPEVEIINCSPGSAMTCFPMANLVDLLQPGAAPEKISFRDHTNDEDQDGTHIETQKKRGRKKRVGMAEPRQQTVTGL